MNSDLSDIASALTGSLPRDGQAGMLGQLKLPDGSTAASSLTFSNELTSGFSRVTTGTIGVNILGVQVATITSAGWNGPVTGNVPIGTMADFAGSTAPSQWYLCYGQAISRTTYSALFAIIGTTYGAGDGSTTFNLPDCRGIVIAGLDNMGGTAANRLNTTWYIGGTPTSLGSIGGVQFETLTASQIPGISFSGSGSGSGAVTGFNNLPNGTTAWSQSANNSVTGNTIAICFSGSVGNVNSLTASVTVGVSGSSTNTGGAPHTSVQPTIVMNKIIYAGA